ncbi:hypothetical protein G9A89_023531 [Geosiphon pyriformis]|nr:hypothetical protein G9A89_023531 [Geosiphon pyriformis]
MDNLVLIFIETKLKNKVFFSSGLNSGYVDTGVAIVMNNSLAKHVYKVSEVPGCLLCIRLLFKNKLLVSILGLYAGVFLTVQFSQAVEINSLIAKAVNEFSFVILGGDFNEDGSHRCASFKKCFDLSLCNSHNVEKTIDFVFVSSNLVNVVVDYSVTDVLEHFNTDHKAVIVSVGLGGFLDIQLSSLHKQANKDHWKFDCEFKAASATNATMLLDAFVVAQKFLDLDGLWDIIRKTMIFSADVSFKKKWFKGYDSVFTKVSSRFYKLKFFDVVHSALAKMRKSYHSFKLLESQWAEESCIKQAIDSRMESFELDKSCTIGSVLKHPFRKVVLDHLIVDDELILEPELVKSKVNEIIEGWTRKCGVVSDFSDNWNHQYKPLDYVFDGTFSDVMCVIGFDEMLAVVSNLPNGKAAGLSGISNKLWKHCDKSVLNMLLVLLNCCLVCESVFGPWREAWVLMIPKPYKWKSVLTNTHPIALIETVRKILFKILSDRISLACSKFNVLCGDNFSVLKGTMMQSPIFAIGSVVENALKKNQKLWLVFSWCSHHSLVFPTHIGITPSNSFLAGVVRIFSGCDLSLGNSPSYAFCHREGTPMSLILGKPNFLKCVSSLKCYGITSAVSSSVDSSLGKSCALFDVYQSHGFGIVCDNLLDVDTACLSVYMDRFLSGLRTRDMKVSAAVFFEDVNSGLGVSMSGLVSSMMVELQAISLALECVSSFCSVNLFLNSQAALDAFKGYLGILGNVQTNALAKNAAFSSLQLPHIVSECFLKAGGTAISGNLRHFVHGVFQSVHRACWEVGSGSGVVSSLVWHLNSHMMASFKTYFMKALHCHFSVAVHKHLYDKCYPSVVCLFCGDIEILDHVFSCFFDAAGHAQLMDIHADAWAVCSGINDMVSVGISA